MRHPITNTSHEVYSICNEVKDCPYRALAEIKELTDTADNSQSNAIALFKVRQVLFAESELKSDAIDKLIGKMYSVAQLHT